MLYVCNPLQRLPLGNDTANIVAKKMNLTEERDSVEVGGNLLTWRWSIEESSSNARKVKTDARTIMRVKRELDVGMR